MVLWVLREVEKEREIWEVGVAMGDSEKKEKEIEFWLCVARFIILGRNTLLVPIFRGCFQFGPSVLKAFNWVPVFLSR